MIPQGRYLVIGAMLLVAAYGARKVYLYYFDETAPRVSIVGFEQDKGYAGDVVGSLKGSSKYKISHLSMWLDDVMMHSEFKINKKQFDYPISIPVASIPDGKHTIKFEIVDATKHQNKITIDRTFYTDNLGLQAALVPLVSGNKVFQGRCLYLQLQVNKPIKSAVVNIFQHKYDFFPESKNSLTYETHIPTECEQEPGVYPFSVEVIDRLGSKMILDGSMQIMGFPFKNTKIRNIANNKLQTELEFTNLQEQDLEEIMLKLAQQSPQEKLWIGLFEVPLDTTGTVTDFGVIRTSQERGKKVHKALDLIGQLYCVIWASNNGVVVLKDRFTHTGNTVVIDHGYGVLSLYCHLQDYANIEVGQKVKKGQPLGRMGMTGYASGHHLHWEIRVKGIPVEPMQWTQRWI